MLASAPQTQTETPNPASTANTRFNALNHGAAARQLFILGENPDDFYALLHDTHRYYKPVSMEQAELVTDLTEARWRLSRCKRAHSANEVSHYSAKPDSPDWTEEEMTRLHRFDRYLTTAERSYQRALTNVRSMHRDNLRTSQWKQLHELQKQKFDLQRQKFEAAQAREKRVIETQEARQAHAANKAVTEIRSAKNAVSSPTNLAPIAPEIVITPVPDSRQPELQQIHFLNPGKN